MKTIIITGANSVKGPIIAEGLKNERIKFWSLHSLFEGTDGRKGRKWGRRLQPWVRALTIIAAASGRVNVVLTCKTEDDLLTDGTMAFISTIIEDLGVIPNEPSSDVSNDGNIRQFGVPDLSVYDLPGLVFMSADEAIQKMRDAGHFTPTEQEG